MSTCWSGEPDYVERLEAEVEQLRTDLESQRRAAVRFEAECERLRAAPLIARGHLGARNAIIEKCAQRAELYDAFSDDAAPDSVLVRKKVADEIRALKDKLPTEQELVVIYNDAKICEECGLPLPICNAIYCFRKGLIGDAESEYKRWIDSYKG